jgi:hypothetical protein
VLIIVVIIFKKVVAQWQHNWLSFGSYQVQILVSMIEVFQFSAVPLRKCWNHHLTIQWPLKITIHHSQWRLPSRFFPGRGMAASFLGWGGGGSQFPRWNCQKISLQVCSVRYTSAVQEYELLTVIVMNSSIFWDIMLCSLLEVNQHLRGICHLHLQGWRKNLARN